MRATPAMARKAGIIKVEARVVRLAVQTLAAVLEVITLATTQTMAPAF